MTSPLRPLDRARARDLRLFLTYRFLSTSYLFVTVFILYFQSRGLSVTEITLLNTVYAGTLILFEVPTGVLADRWGRRRAMVLGSLLMAAGALVDWAGRSFLAFAVGDGLLALGMTLSSGADSAWLFDMLHDAGRGHQYRRREGAASAAKLVGAAAALAAGGWIGKHDLGATYLVTAVVCLGAAAVASMLHEPEPRAARRPVTQQISASASVVVRHGPLLFAVLFSTLIFTLLRMGLYLHQPYLTRAGFAIEDVGVVMALLSLAAAWGAHRIETLRRLVGEHGLLWGVPVALGLSYLVLGRWFAPWGIGLLLVQSVLNGVYSPFSKELINREIQDSGQRATVLSVESMVRRIAFGLFAPLCGGMIDLYGLGAGFYACAALGLVGTGALVLPRFRRRSPARPVVEEPSPTPATMEEIERRSREGRPGRHARLAAAEIELP